MPKVLVVGSEEFDFPLENENGNYGEQVTDWATAVSDALQTVQAPNDIPTSTAAILNNVSSPTAVQGFSFDTSEVIAITGEYIVTRTTIVPASNLTQSGKIEGNFDGSSWSITCEQVKDAGVSFDITTGGQITYTSTNVTGSNYTGTIVFKAKVFNQPE